MLQLGICILIHLFVDLYVDQVLLTATLRQPWWNQCKNQMHSRFIFWRGTCEALCLKIGILPSLIHSAGLGAECWDSTYSVATPALCRSGRSVVSTLTGKSVSDHLSLHVIILANEAGGESA